MNIRGLGSARASRANFGASPKFPPQKSSRSRGRDGRHARGHDFPSQLGHDLRRSPSFFTAESRGKTKHRHCSDRLLSSWNFHQALSFPRVSLHTVTGNHTHSVRSNVRHWIASLTCCIVRSLASIGCSRSQTRIQHFHKIGFRKVRTINSARMLAYLGEGSGEDSGSGTDSDSGGGSSPISL